MKNQVVTLSLVFTLGTALLLCAEGCRRNGAVDEIDSYADEIKRWQANRALQIGNDNGWLSLSGLFWLKEGENPFGTDSSNAVIFPPGSSPAKAGSISLKKENIILNAPAKSNIKCNDSLITRMKLISDESGIARPTILTTGSLSFYVVKRGDRFAVRLKDKNNPPLKNFKGLEFYPVNPELAISASYRQYDQPKILEISSIIGTVTPETCRAALIFDINGRSCTLDVISDDVFKELHVMFTDETTGKETYGNGRQLMTTIPDDEGKVILDFNKAYNWPCAYTPYATCPIPPKQNHIPVRIEAGEKKYLRTTDILN